MTEHDTHDPGNEHILHTPGFNKTEGLDALDIADQVAMERVRDLVSAARAETEQGTTPVAQLARAMSGLVEVRHTLGVQPEQPLVHANGSIVASDMFRITNEVASENPHSRIQTDGLGENPLAPGSDLTNIDLYRETNVDIETGLSIEQFSISTYSRKTGEGQITEPQRNAEEFMRPAGSGASRSVREHTISLIQTDNEWDYVVEAKKTDGLGRPAGMQRVEVSRAAVERLIDKIVTAEMEVRMQSGQ